MSTSVEIETTNPDLEGRSAIESDVAQSRTIQRRHDLDALRAIAMLLGIVLHSALSFAPLPWFVSDVNQSKFYEVLFSAIHGFRMPLFFMISGFFTAMLWRKRGLGGLLTQRVKRILVPLLVSCLTIVPIIWLISNKVSQTPGGQGNEKYFDAAAAGDYETILEGIESSATTIDALHPGSGASLLTVAIFFGQPETVKVLLENGADPNQRNADSGTPLHAAVFMGRVESAKRLLQAGANPGARDGSGKTPADNLKVDFGSTNGVALMFGVSLDKEELTSARAEIAKLLNVDQVNTNNEVGSDPGIEALYGLLFQFPFFMHLWFLAFLCWLVIAFVGYSLIAQALPLARLPKWLFCSPLSLVWLVPITMLSQHFMSPWGFGPDSSVGLLPIPSVLGYYAIFFFFGAIYWDLDDHEGILGRWWYVMLPLALFVVFPVGLELVMGTFGFLSDSAFHSSKPILGSLFEALFAWLMLFGSIGMFRALLSRENKTMRYISDSSYWLYLAHLPLVVLAQGFVKDWPLPSAIKFVGMTVIISMFLLLTYEYLIRYTIIGTMLNGPRKREQTASTTS